MALYNFTDTIERALRAGLPSEALNFNGKFLEDEIDGYRTLNVIGREALESEIDAIETKARHGARFRSRRHLPRIITVSYQMSARTATELMEKFNKLNFILDEEEATLIFNDEPDKFFIGTRQNLKPPKEGALVTRGEIDFYCADPFKYSVRQYEVSAVDGAISVRYNGTQANPPAFRIQAHGDVAFVEFLKDTARVVCGMSYDMAREQSGAGREIFNTKTDPNGFETMSALMGWQTLTSCIPEITGVYGSCSPGTPGTDEPDWFRPGMAWPHYYQTKTISGEEWLVPYKPKNALFVLLSNGEYLEEPAIEINPESGSMSMDDIVDYDDDSYQLIGGAMQYDISMNRTNFEMDFESRFYADNTSQRGAQAFTIYGDMTVTGEEDDEEVTTTIKLCGLVIRKSAVGTNRLEISVYIGDKRADTIIMTALPSNPVFGLKSLRCSISRFGNVYTVRIGNDAYTYQSNNAIIPTHMTAYILDYDASPEMTCNAIRYIRFVEHTASSAKAVANIIRNGDEVVADCASAEIIVNGVKEPEFGDIMNQWDEMDLLPGENNIGINMVRDTSARAPEITMVYREAYL